MKEEYLLTGPLEKTNEPYAVAKIAGIKMCQSYNRQYGTMFLSVMPTNLYGQNDNFDLETSHVLPALIRKFHEAKVNDNPSVEMWGTGKPRREFLHVDDLAEACVFLMDIEDGRYRDIVDDPTPLINIGYGKDLTILELAQLVKEIVGFNGDIINNTTKPDGTPQKLLDTTKIKALGWNPSISLNRGLVNTYGWCLDNKIFNMET